MAFIPPVCPSYEVRTHSWDRTDIVPRLPWITSLLYCTTRPLTEHREWMTLHTGFPTFICDLNSLPSQTTSENTLFYLFYWKVPPESIVLTHPMAPAKLKFRPRVSTPPITTLYAISHHLHFLDFLPNLMELCVFALLVSQKRQDLTQNPVLAGLWPHSQVCLDWMGKNKLFSWRTGALCLLSFSHPEACGVNETMFSKNLISPKRRAMKPSKFLCCWWCS